MYAMDLLFLKSGNYYNFIFFFEVIILNDQTNFATLESYLYFARVLRATNLR